MYKRPTPTPPAAPDRKSREQMSLLRCIKKCIYMIYIYDIYIYICICEYITE